MGASPGGKMEGGPPLGRGSGLINRPKGQPKTPAMAAGLADHVWSLAELLTQLAENSRVIGREVNPNSGDRREKSGHNSLPPQDLDHLNCD